jgi:pimeloyl-ACP methyl ester carboxylesterase
VQSLPGGERGLLLFEKACPIHNSPTTASAQRRYWVMISRAFLALLLGLPSPAVGAAPAALATPTLVKSVCAVRLPSDEKIDCYLLSVPENRSREGSNPIHLPVIVFRSRSATPRPDPVIFTAGGPGASSLGAFSSGKTIRLLYQRDFIVFEQRGTKYAQPSLDCPDVDAERESSFLSGLGTRADETKELEAARACFHRLTGSGIDLAGYNNREIAQDIIDLRNLLGVKSWNLYGLSYSTWIMMDVMRMDPAGVRSALLESLEPPDVPYDEMGNANLQCSLDVLFDACAGSRVFASVSRPTVGLRTNGAVARSPADSDCCKRRFRWKSSASVYRT